MKYPRFGCFPMEVGDSVGAYCPRDELFPSRDSGAPFPLIREIRL